MSVILTHIHMKYYLLNISGYVYTIMSVLCITQLAVQLHSAAELQSTFNHLLLCGLSPENYTICCCVAPVQKIIQTIIECRKLIFWMFLKTTQLGRPLFLLIQRSSNLNNKHAPIHDMLCSLKSMTSMISQGINMR